MLSFSGSLRVFVAVEACDMRKGFEGLSALVGSVLNEQVKSGALFAFSNRRRTRLNIRAWLHLSGLKPDQPLLPNRFGSPMTRTAVQQRLRLYVRAAQNNCPSLRNRRILSPHTIRHPTAMHLLQSGVATPVIALWLGHEDPATTHQYIEADLIMKENALRRLQPLKGKHFRFRPRPQLLQFLDSL